MKTHITRLICPLYASLFAIALLGCFPMAGCASSSRKAAAPATNNASPLTQLRDDLRTTRAALDRTTEALNRIPSSPNALNAYNEFNAELIAFDKLSAKSLLRSDRVHENGNALFTQWEQETQSIQAPAIREIADQRRSTVLASYNALNEPLITARADLTDVTTLLTDLRKALAMDLTPSGIVAIQKPLEKANRRSAEFSSSLDNIALQLEHIANSIPATPTSASAPPK